MNRSIPAGSGSSRAVRRLLPSASHRGRLKRLLFTARSITVPACGTFVLAVLLAGLPAHAQRGCGAGGLTLGPALEPEMVFIPGGSFRMPEMVFIPGGRFRMGDLQGVGSANEKPVHTVTIKPFAVGKYEITRAQFEVFVDETGHDAGGIWRNPGFSQTGEHPVVGVSWDDARAYIAWLNGGRASVIVCCRSLNGSMWRGRGLRPVIISATTRRRLGGMPTAGRMYALTVLTVRHR